MENLKDICNQAMIEGKKLDLSDCIYGEAHWRGPFSNESMTHHYFIAGFVRTQNCRNMLDLGTHYGGSAMAMSKGVAQSGIQDLKIATVDITFKNEEGFKKYPHINRFKGDSLSRKIIDEITAFFNGPIDLLFIDTDHKAAFVWRSIAVYIEKLKPKYILIDDIHLNPSMEKAWKRIRSELKEGAFDASKILDRNAGFGVVRCSYPLSIRMQPDLWFSYLFLQMKHSIAEYLKNRQHKKRIAGIDGNR